MGTGRFDPSRLVPEESSRRIRVHFNADRADQLPWSFVPQQKFVEVLPGETSLAFYRAKNEGPRDIIGIATYNVTPDRVSLFLFYIIGGMEVLITVDGVVDSSILLKSRMFLFRGAETLGGRRS